jgi:hypothetical protein
LFKRLTRFIVFCAAVQILGGHWMALQSMAWVGMIASYARGEKLVIAIEKTFDGDHPCGLCEVVKKGREQEQKQQVARVIVKLEAVISAVAQIAVPPALDCEYESRVETLAVRSLDPPTPPPLAV